MRVKNFKYIFVVIIVSVLLLNLLFVKTYKEPKIITNNKGITQHSIFKENFSKNIDDKNSIPLSAYTSKDKSIFNSEAKYFPVIMLNSLQSCNINNGENSIANNLLTRDMRIIDITNLNSLSSNEIPGTIKEHNIYKIIRKVSLHSKQKELNQNPKNLFKVVDSIGTFYSIIQVKNKKINPNKIVFSHIIIQHNKNNFDNHAKIKVNSEQLNVEDPIVKSTNKTFYFSQFINNRNFKAMDFFVYSRYLENVQDYYTKEINPILIFKPTKKIVII